MASNIKYNELVPRVFEMLIKGGTASEIMKELGLTNVQWVNITKTPKFIDLIHYRPPMTNLESIKEIEKELWEAMEIHPRGKELSNRIDALKIRYSSFLLS